MIGFLIAISNSKFSSVNPFLVFGLVLGGMVLGVYCLLQLSKVEPKNSTAFDQVGSLIRDLWLFQGGDGGHIASRMTGIRTWEELRQGLIEQLPRIGPECANEYPDFATCQGQNVLYKALAMERVDGELEAAILDCLDCIGDVDSIPAITALIHRLQNKPQTGSAHARELPGRGDSGLMSSPRVDASPRSMDQILHHSSDKALLEKAEGCFASLNALISIGRHHQTLLRSSSSISKGAGIELLTPAAAVRYEPPDELMRPGV
jgi:hypothetical protein